VSRVRVAVAVEDDARYRIYEVVAACCALGLDHTGTHAGVGLLTGTIESDDLARLLAIPGVLTVEIKHGCYPGTAGMIQ
jgi:hypothetical protein